MKKVLNNYYSQVGLLFASVFCMNFTSKVVYCALLFTFLTFILNIIANHHGPRKATISILLSTITSLGLLYDKQYCIAGKPIGGLIGTSLFAILVAGYIGFKLFLKLKATYSFVVSNFISLLIAAFVDHLIMGLFFTKVFPMHKVWLICYKETAYTALFVSVVCLCSAAILYVKVFYSNIKTLYTFRPLSSK
ncbi:hypothetical protein [Cardinium endosymbiont of Bemisia tabaci]|uniref:hypothetical protein n=1 Tax=Cardinium endosymbiont of Bemisia tabaci TaxID=672794 RepID=UPI000442D12F|nr:hypothetical protein [Cardinium endosymbiont of Bemisia tabaci]CDG49858.1 Hypothetical protein CHV_b0005 [Cardinium endosymbiont cBtQ1 of Bemisia tabaci]